MHDSFDASDTSGSVTPVDSELEFRQGPLVHIPSVSNSPRGLTLNKASVESEECKISGDMSEWIQHKYHIVVFTYSGKPVFTRYGTEDSIAGLTGTLQALVAKFVHLGLCEGEDGLQSISVGDTRIVFLDRSPLILTCISKQPNIEEASILRVLSGIHSQLMFILTGGINKTLESHPSFDPRTLLGGTRSLLLNLISWMHHDMLLSIHDSAVEPLPLPFEARASITELLAENIPECGLYGFLLCGHRVISTFAARGSPQIVSAADITLLINLVISSTSLHSGESWTPVCLPSVSTEAFVYAYIQFFSREVAYICLSLNPENDNFHAISNHGQQVKSALGNDLLYTIQEWSMKCPITLLSLGSIDGTPEKTEALLRVRHCAIVLNQSRQIFSSKLNPCSLEDHEYKQIFRNYQSCVCLLNGGSPTSQQVSLVRGDDFVFVWFTAEFQFFLTAPRGIDISIITYVYQWIRDNEQTLFISNIGNTGTCGTRINSKAPSLW